MPQDINQGIFPELVGAPPVSNNKTDGNLDTLDGHHHESMEASLPVESVDSSSAIIQPYQNENSENGEIQLTQNLCKGPLPESVLPLSLLSAQAAKPEMRSKDKETPGYLLMDNNLNSVEKESSSSGQFSEREDETAMMLCEGGWMTGSNSQTEDLLFHFDRFFRRRFETELDQFHEAMESMFSEQQIHLKQIMLKSDCDDPVLDDLTDNQIDDVDISADIGPTVLPSEGPSVVINTSGWDKRFDAEVRTDEVRRPVSRLQTPAGNSKRIKRKASVESARIRTHVSQLKRDDDVNIQQEGTSIRARVHVVDRFQGTVILELPNNIYETVSVADVTIHKPTEKDVLRPRKYQRRLVNKNCPAERMDTQNVISQVPVDKTHNSVIIGEDASIETNLAVSPKGVVIRSGLVYHIEKAEGNILFLVKYITLKLNSTHVTGTLVIAGEVSQITVTAPISALVSENKLWKENLQIVKETRAGIGEKLMNATWAERFIFRRCQLSCLIFKEIKHSLKSKARQRQCLLGMLSVDTDLAVLPIKLQPGQRVQFGYHTKFHHLSLLDKLLPQQWDILSTDGNLNFVYVTKITFSLSSDIVLKMSVSSSICRQLLDTDYRTQITKDFQSIINKQTAESSDSEEEPN